MTDFTKDDEDIPNMSYEMDGEPVLCSGISVCTSHGQIVVIPDKICDGQKEPSWWKNYIEVIRPKLEEESREAIEKNVKPDFYIKN